jgi:hypothetical protein
MLSGRRPATICLAVAACAATGFVGATVLGAAGEPSPASEGPADLSGRPGSDALANQQPDPLGEGPDWALTVFTAANGQRCAAAGRVVDGKVGLLRSDGSFVPYSISEGATCVDLDAVPAGVQVAMGAQGDARTVIHGIAGPQVETIVVGTPERSFEPEIGDRGSYLAVLDPARAKIGEVTVRARLHDGRTLTLYGG